MRAIPFMGIKHPENMISSPLISLSHCSALLPKSWVRFAACSGERKRGLLGARGPAQLVSSYLGVIELGL